MKGDLIEHDDVLKEIWEWIANREYQYTNATHWLQKRIEAIPCAEDKADRKTENSSEKPNNSTISKMEQVDKPQTYITEDRDTQILDAWQVHHRSTTSVEGEPQSLEQF